MPQPSPGPPILHHDPRQGPIGPRLGWRRKGDLSPCTRKIHRQGSYQVPYLHRPTPSRVRANERKFSSDTNKVTYACSYLDEVAFSWYENFVAKIIEPAWFHDFGLFELELSSQFGTINASAIAERKLQSSRMRPGDQINDYLTRFRALKNDVDWNDSALSFAFRQGLPSRIKDEVARNDTRPRNLTELIELVIRIDFQHWDREYERNQERYEDRGGRSDPHPRPSDRQTPRPNNGRNDTPMTPNNRFSSPKPAYAPRTPGHATGDRGTPLPLDKQGKVTTAERERRFANKLCSYCGGEHFMDKCPKKSPQPTTNARVGTTHNPATFTVGGDDNFGSDSGNE
ncbi:hypothetical protein RQP46_011468 [Phenoliferia psychrophenolica]